MSNYNHNSQLVEKRLTIVRYRISKRIDNIKSVTQDRIDAINRDSAMYLSLKNNQ